MRTLQIRKSFSNNEYLNLIVKKYTIGTSIKEKKPIPISRYPKNLVAFFILSKSGANIMLPIAMPRRKTVNIIV